MVSIVLKQYVMLFDDILDLIDIHSKHSCNKDLTVLKSSIHCILFQFLGELSCKFRITNWYVKPMVLHDCIAHITELRCW